MIIGQIEIIYTPTVNTTILHSPILHARYQHQPATTAAGFSLKCVISTHHLSHISLLDQRFKGRQVGLHKSSRRPMRYKVAVPLRSAMHSEMLCAGVGLEIIG